MKFWMPFLFISIVYLSCQSNKKHVSATVVKSTTSEAEDSLLMAFADPSNPNGILVTCNGVGKINMTDTYADVINKAGKENVILDSVLMDGKNDLTFRSKVWKGTTGEITINWKENRPPFLTIKEIVIDYSAASYVLINGLHLGSKLSGVSKLNGKPFSLRGFGGANKGLVVSYNNGNLAQQIPCVMPVFGLKIKIEDFDKITALVKNGIESSEVYTARKIDPVVIKLIINSKR